MRKFGPQISLFVLLLAAAITLACGSSSSASTHVLKTIEITPPSAEGQAQFTALGFYEPAYEAPVILTVNWGACYQNAPTTAVTVSGAGLAQCGTSASGTYTVFGSQLTQCTAITACGGGCQITGTAQLSCP